MSDLGRGETPTIPSETSGIDVWDRAVHYASMAVSVAAGLFGFSFITKPRDD